MVKYRNWSSAHFALWNVVDRVTFPPKKKEERITVLLTHIENEEPWESVELQPFFNSAVLRSKVKNFNFIKFERINSE